MPLSVPTLRQALHQRFIECRGYQRQDCLWDIEAHLVDTKNYTFKTQSRGELTPGEAVHDMWLRITVDDDLVIYKVEAAIDAAPFAICPNIIERFPLLEGLRITSGWNRKVKELLGNVQGCTHLVELLGPLATTAFQSIYPVTRARRLQREKALPHRKPPMLDSCHAFASDSPVVKRYWPKFYTGTEVDDEHKTSQVV